MKKALTVNLEMYRRNNISSQERKVFGQVYVVLLSYIYSIS